MGRDEGGGVAEMRVIEVMNLDSHGVADSAKEAEGSERGTPGMVRSHGRRGGGGGDESWPRLLRRSSLAILHEPLQRPSSSSSSPGPAPRSSRGLSQEPLRRWLSSWPPLTPEESLAA